MKLFVIFFIGLFVHVKAASIHVCGATTIQPIIEKVASEYYKNSGETLIIEGGGTEAGLDGVRTKTCDIAMVARGLRDEEKEHCNHVTIGIDAVALAHNKNMDIKNLSKKEIIALYDGTIKNWKMLGYAYPSMTVISRKTDRATLDVFEAYSGLKSPKRKNLPAGAKLIRADALEAESNINTLLLIAGLKGSVGIVSHAEAIRYEKMSYPIRVSAVDGVCPTNKSIKTKEYPIVRELNLVWDKNSTKAEQFIKWSSGKVFSDSVESLGFVVVDR